MSAHPYWQRGYWAAPVASALPDVEDLRSHLNAAVAGSRHAAPLNRTWRHDEMRDHPLREWARALGTRQAILDAVASAIGPDIYLRNIDVIRLRPLSVLPSGWHVDRAARNEESDGAVSVWLGLCDVTRRNGCLQLVRGSHREPGGPPRDVADMFHGLTKVDPELRDHSHLAPGEVIYSELAAGQFSLHHPNTWHRASANLTRRYRDAVVFRFFSARLTNAAAGCGEARLVAGRDRARAFRSLEDAPLRIV